MGHDTQFYAPGRFSWGWRRWQAGLTLVEVIVAAGMISVTCSSVMFAFTSLNQMAMVSRLYTGAAINAQSQIDLISTDSPFEPQYNIVPSELQPGTTSTSVTVYRDPISNFTVTGTMTTTVTAANGTYANGSNTDTLYLYEATVTVTYSYRNRNYSVSMSTLRTADV
jgi:type II secretory pathway pseudopilin PulG